MTPQDKIRIGKSLRMARMAMQGLGDVRGQDGIDVARIEYAHNALKWAIQDLEAALAEAEDD